MRGQEFPGDEGGKDMGKDGPYFSVGGNMAVSVFVASLLPRIPGAVMGADFKDGDCPGFCVPSLGLVFRGIPGRREEAILLDFFLTCGKRPDPGDAVSERPGLRLFVSGHCPHCPGALRFTLGLLGKTDMELEVVSVDHCPEMAAAWRVMAVPALMVRGDEENFRWTGAFSFSDVEKTLEDRDPENLGEESLRNILESGEAQRLAAMMVSRRRIFPAFYSLLTHEKWTVRLGAMVTVESLIPLSGDLGEGLLERLWTEKDGMDPVILGDMVYLMGCGDPRVWRPRLAHMMESATGMLREALEEALERLEEKR